MSTANRRLETLTLLQSHPGISATALAQRLGVTERTTRRDIAQLRELGYRIDGEPGRAGGYRLTHGRTMPPLLLDADEVAAVTLGLRAAVQVDGLETSAITALAKLAQIVPARWQSRLNALAAIQSPTAPVSRRPDRDVLVALALACRAGEAVRIRLRSAVDVAPHRLVTLRQRWYLVAWPRGESAWRVYAVDRIRQVQPLGTRFPTPEPPPDAAALAADALAHGPWRHTVRVRVHTSADLVRELVDPTVATVLDNGDDCELRFNTDDLDWAARWLTYLNLDLDVLEPKSLNNHLHTLGTWLMSRH